MTKNLCEFSPCRTYRYSLIHTWESRGPRIAWIGLNPSTADENQLDPTLRRIEAFSAAWGYGSFVMLNLFAFRATDPRDMRRSLDPGGPENIKTIRSHVHGCKRVILAWGTHGTCLNVAPAMVRMLRESGMTPECLKLNSNGTPAHPLYLKGDLRPIPYPSFL